MTQTILDARAGGCIMNKMKSLEFKVQKSEIQQFAEKPTGRSLRA